MTLQQLEYIVAVDNFRSFVKAADYCNVAQPSLSAQVMKLEEELDIKIFERSRRGVETTEVGKSIIETARATLDEAKKIQDICQLYKNEVRGTLRLGMIPTISPYLIPHFISAITSTYPDFKIEIQEDKTERLIELLDQGLIDAAILSTPKKAPLSLMEKVLYYEPFVLYAGKEHALLRKKKVAMNDLAEFSPTLLDDTHCMRDQVEAVCGRLAKESNVTLKAGTLPTLIRLVAEQKTYTLLPYLALESLTEDQKKDHVVIFEEPVPSRKVSLIFHRSFVKRPLLEALSKCILENLPQNLIRIQERSKLKVVDPQKRHFG